MTIKTGTKVGSKRWPCHGAHVDCWGKPWAGIVLDVTDPLAWAGTIAFAGRDPDPEAVRKHVEWCKSWGGLSDCVPVAWEFGKVWWESADGLRPYAEDVREWEGERTAERARTAGLRLAAC